MNTATAKSNPATECAKHFRIALVWHLIQRDIAWFDIRAYCSSEHTADLTTLPQRIPDTGTNIPIRHEA
jgi:hypothetical protein